jgi:hypothetical protein
MMKMADYFARFGETIARSGIASIPDAIFSFQKELGLSVGECWFVAQILRFKWTTELPRPSLRKMAAYTGVSERTLHNYKNSLIEKKYLTPHNRTDQTGRKDTNYYDFSPLFDAIVKLLDKKDNKVNPIEEETEEIESEEGVSEKFSDTLSEIFSDTLSEIFSEHKQKIIQTEKYYNNNNPPSEDGGNNTRPAAGVVVDLTDSLQEKREKEEVKEIMTEPQKCMKQTELEIEDLIQKYSRLTGRKKESLIRKLASQYGAERVRKGIEYLEEMLQRTSVVRPEGFLVKLLEERWDIEGFDRKKLDDERRMEREKQKLKLLKKNMKSRASPEVADRYIRRIKEILGVKKCENTDVLECGGRCRENDPGSSLGPGSEGEGKGRPG